jgi:hypothetical protein
MFVDGERTSLINGFLWAEVSNADDALFQYRNRQYLRMLRYTAALIEIKHAKTFPINH